MSTLTTTLLTLIFTIALSCASGQVSDHNIRRKVLQKAIVDSTFIFGKWTEKGGTETQLTYLGQVVTKPGHTFKIMKSIWFWGLAHRATSRILVFNRYNEYAGNYYLKTTSDLPTRMENGNLIFKNTDGNCDKKLTTIVNLKNGLPKRFFRKCKKHYGDIYSFDNQ